MTTPSTGVNEDAKRRALALAGHVLVRIRMLSRADPADGLQPEEKLQLIEKLADSAHNLPPLVATLGDNSWATEDTLLMECGLCEGALREAALFEA
jgi:hypothetical protein